MKFRKLVLRQDVTFEGSFTLQRIEADRRPHELVGPRANMPVDSTLMFVGMRGFVQNDEPTVERVAVPQGSVLYAVPFPDELDERARAAQDRWKAENSEPRGLSLVQP